MTDEQSRPEQILSCFRMLGITIDLGPGGEIVRYMTGDPLDPETIGRSCEEQTAALNTPELDAQIAACPEFMDFLRNNLAGEELAQSEDGRAMIARLQVDAMEKAAQEAGRVITPWSEILRPPRRWTPAIDG